MVQVRCSPQSSVQLTVLGDQHRGRKGWSALCAPNLPHHLTDHHNNGLNVKEAAEVDDVLLTRTNLGKRSHTNARNRAAIKKNQCKSHDVHDQHNTILR